MVRIKNGPLKGMFIISRKDRKLSAFRGVPYAQPPLGDLRFEKNRRGYMSLYNFALHVVYYTSFTLL